MNKKKNDKSKSLPSPSVGMAANTTSSKKMLSRAALYTSLAAYNQAQLDPQAFMRRQSSKAVHESSLMQFLQTVSAVTCGYPSQQQQQQPKNKAKLFTSHQRPLNQQEVSDRLREKALTLVGGGINTAVTSSAEKRSRKRRRTTSLQSTSKKSKAGKIPMAFWENQPTILASQLEFVDTLNQEWNKYIRRLIRSVEERPPDVPTISSRIKQLATTIEWIGAKVYVQKCPQHLHYENKSGILIGETSCTWRVVDLSYSKDESEEAEVSPRQQIRILVIPKQRSTLAVLIPLNAAGYSDKQSDNLQNSSQHLCVVLQECPALKK